jgi:hypothetical protein
MCLRTELLHLLLASFVALLTCIAAAVDAHLFIIVEDEVLVAGAKVS